MRTARRVLIAAAAIAATTALTAGTASATTVTGNCGTATLELRDGPGSGTVSLYMRINHYPMYPMRDVSYSVSWRNNTTRVSGVYPGGEQASGTVWESTRTIYSGSGYVNATGSYRALLADGSVCYSASGLSSGTYAD